MLQGKIVQVTVQPFLVVTLAEECRVKDPSSSPASSFLLPLAFPISFARIDFSKHGSDHIILVCL